MPPRSSDDYVGPGLIGVVRLDLLALRRYNPQCRSLRGARPEPAPSCSATGWTNPSGSAVRTDGPAVLWDLDWAYTGPWLMQGCNCSLTEALCRRHIAVVVMRRAASVPWPGCQAVGRLDLPHSSARRVCHLPPDELKGPGQSCFFAHHVEQSQAAFIARDGERFLE